MSVWVGVLLVYGGLAAAFCGVVCVVKPLRFLRLRTRRAGTWTLGAGLLVVAAGWALPAPLLHAPGPPMRLDEFAPAYQFHEVHETEVRASPARIHRAIREVTASEIRFFRLLTWIRCPTCRRESILNAPGEKPLLEGALRGGFLLLAEDEDREIVFGTLLGPRPEGPLAGTPLDYAAFARPGYAKATMNFLVAPSGPGACRLRTETRVYATDDSARRSFALYWRLIYPGSAIIRVMWLEAIKKRAEA